MKWSYFFLFAFILANLALASAATIKGTLYDQNFDLVKNARVTVNTSPDQAIVTKEGEYSFELPEGTYLLQAFVYDNGTIESKASEEISVKEEGIFTLDLIVFPISFGDDLGQSFGDDFSLNDDNSNNFGVIITVILILIILFLIGVIFRNRILSFFAEKKKEEVSGDLKKIIKIIEKNGKRMNQKDLRKELPYSEAKVSLMIADLEARGIVKRVKRGRGNMLILQ